MKTSPVVKTNLLICLIIFPILISGQTIFQKTVGRSDLDNGKSIATTIGVGFIIAATTTNYGDNSDIYVINTDYLVDTIWTRTYGGPGEDIPASICATIDTGYLIAANTQSFGEGLSDILLIKVNIDGDTLWTRTFGDTGEDYVYDVIRTSDSGIVVAGSRNSGGIYNDACLIKLDANGNTEWSKIYGGDYNDEAHSIWQIEDGFIFAGTTVDEAGGDANIYVVSTDLNGDTLWTRSYGGNDEDYANKISPTDHGFIIVGQTLSFGAGNWDMYCLHIDTIGNLMWSKTFGGPDEDYGIGELGYSGYHGFNLFGSTNNDGIGGYDYYYVCINSDGDTIRTRTYGSAGDEMCNDVTFSKEAGYVMSGYTTEFGSDGTDVYLVKADWLGNGICNQSGTQTIVADAATETNFTHTDVGNLIENDSYANVVSHSGGTITEICDGVEIDEIGPDELNIYPNPSSGNIYISSIYNIEEIKIMDITGNIISVLPCNYKNAMININQSGIYIMHIATVEGSISEKVVIVK